MGRLDSTFTPNQMKQLKRWLVFRQHEGFHGRPNKPDDTCYSFWVGAALKVRMFMCINSSLCVWGNFNINILCSIFF